MNRIQNKYQETTQEIFESSFPDITNHLEEKQKQIIHQIQKICKPDQKLLQSIP